MRREIIETADGSTSIYLPDWEESYHSKHGAVQEAKHVFLERGLALFEGAVAVLEIGFGTGLNAFLTLLEGDSRGMNVDYVGVEAYPVNASEIAMMNYPALADASESENLFKKLHEAEWEQPTAITPHFMLTKRQQYFSDIDDDGRFNLIYFDAFGYRVQPELWSEDIFIRMYRALRPGGILVTYAARTAIKRNMEAAGFTVEKMAGPPGKREMFRARKA